MVKNTWANKLTTLVIIAKINNLIVSIVLDQKVPYDKPLLDIITRAFTRVNPLRKITYQLSPFIIALSRTAEILIFITIEHYIRGKLPAGFIFCCGRYLYL